jgi:hypothetical protein
MRYNTTPAARSDYRVVIWAALYFSLFCFQFLLEGYGR